MSAKSLVGTVLGFLQHHVNDLANVVGAIGSLSNALPIDPQDKAKVNDALSALEASVAGINDFLTNHASSVSDVVVKESDLENAVANYFASDKGKEALATATKGNANG